MLYRVASAGGGEYKWFDEVDGTPDDLDVGRRLPPAQTFYHAPRLTSCGMIRERWPLASSPPSETSIFGTASRIS